MILEYFSIHTLITSLTVVATATMAVTGVIQAIRHQFDPLGAGVLALITAVGGGTLRDILLGATPVFWITDQIYIATVVPVVVIGVVFANRMHAGGGRRERLLNHIDAIGLALFTIVGVQKALEFGVPPVIAIILGAITGVAGGMIRDLLCNEKPVVLREDFYASLSLLGGALFVVLNYFQPLEISSLVSFIFMVLGRFLVLRKSISLPSLGKK